jgi:hypothetical protein
MIRILEALALEPVQIGIAAGQLLHGSASGGLSSAPWWAGSRGLPFRWPSVSLPWPWIRSASGGARHTERCRTLRRMGGLGGAIARHRRVELRAGYRARLVAPLLRGEDVVGRRSLELRICCRAISTRLCSTASAPMRSSRTCCCIPDRALESTALVEESLNLAYHGARAEKQGFNITLERSFDAAAGEVDLFPQEITRVLLNLISNGFYAATKRKVDANGGDYEPTLTAATKSLGDSVEIRIRDNGTGIPPEVKEKLFNPFFTTKPAGEGTGLGLSISHNIIVKQHGGSIEVDTRPGEFTEFRIILPRAGASVIKSGERT